VKDCHEITGRTDGLIYTDAAHSYTNAMFPRLDEGDVMGRDGACRLIRRERHRVDKAAHPHAGGIALHGDSDARLLPDDKGGYPPIHKRYWSSGHSLSIKADGAAIPAFQAQLIAPTAVVFGAGPASVLQIDRNADYQVTWLNGTKPDLLFLSINTLGKDFGLKLECRFPAESGRGTRPSALLKRLPPGRTYYVAKSLGATTATAGRWQVEIQAVFYVAQGAADLQ
jgi:hypothetical protein